MSKSRTEQDLEKRVKLLESQVQQQQIIIQDLLQQVFQMRQVLPNKETSDKETRNKIQDRTRLLNFMVSKNEAPYKCPVLKKEEIYWCGPSTISGEYECYQRA